MKKKKRILSICMLAFAFMLMLGMSANVEAKKKKKVTSIAKAKITLSKTSYTYNGKLKKPAVTVKVGKKKLKKKRDYTVSYKNNKKVGKATVTVKARKKYKGTKKKTFKINKANRTLIPEKTSYSAVVGDAAFSITAKTSKGGGTISYTGNNASVIKVSSAGKVTVVAAGKATVKISVTATGYYNATTISVPVTINKKPVREVDTLSSIKNFNYPILNYACTSKTLLDLQWAIVDKYPIPGLGPTIDDDLAKGYIKCNNLCPQGICFAGDYLLTTAYCMDKVHPSCIFVYSKKTGEYLKTLELTKKSHVGGITFDGENVWVCHSDSYDLQRIPYSAIVKYASGTKGCVAYNPDELELVDEEEGMHGVTEKPSAVAYNPKDGYIWITQFQAKKTSTMVAYQYTGGKLKAVTRYLNSKEQDYLGIESEDASAKACEEVGVTTGAAITAVHKDGVADLAGYQTGDVIVELDGKEVKNQKDIDTIMESHKAGDSVKMIALRKNKDANAAVTGSGVSIVDRIVATMTLAARTVQKAERSIPERVQGVTFTTSGKAVFSISYGRNTARKYYDSRLMVYDADWKNVYEDDKWQPILAVALPPMVEEVEVNGDEIYMLFESAAMTYLEGTDNVDKDKSECPIDKIVSVKLNVD